MRRIYQNKWTILAIVSAVVAGFLLAIWVQGGTQRAEAVIGGIGNVTDNNNPHNFAWGSTGAASSDPNETRVCVFCHTPHAADMTPSLLNAPLWNHTLSSGVIYSVATPGVYSGSPVSGNVYLLATPLSNPDGASKLCLSCHDGTVSVGNVRSELGAGGIPMQAITNEITSGGMIDPNSAAYIGSNLTSMHPVSIPMNDQLKNDHNNLFCGVNGQTTGLRYPWETGYGSTVFLRPTNATYSSVPGISGANAQAGCGADTGCSKNYSAGYNYGVQCSTCHDPHLWTNTADPQTAGYKMLVTGTNNLCSACHITTCP